jgi:DNA-binding CsgD family transcriptional regulator
MQEPYDERVSIFIGRDRERAQLAERVRAASAGRGQVVLVAGEPGVGKTRLAEEAAAGARALGMVCAVGRATDEEGSPPFWPVRQVLRAVGVADILMTGNAADDRVDVAAQERFRLYESVVEAIAVAAAPQGLFVLFDDIHWADAGTLRLLIHLTRNLGDTRVVVVATYRSTETASSPALRDALAALAREPSVARLRLAGLTEPEVSAQLDAVTGFAVPASVAAAVHRRTGGNPFFVGELGRLLAEEQLPEERPLPEGVRDAVRARLGRLTPDCRTVVCAGAVLGAALDATVLSAATGLDLDAVLAALDEAGAAGIVSSTGFSHDLIREAAAQEVVTAQRLALHARTAQCLMGRASADVRVGEIAYHLVESLPVGDAPAAVAWSRRAADRAMAQLAWEEAAAWYGRALDAANSDELSIADRAAVLIDRARAQVRGYDIEGARQSVLAAADIARAAGDGEGIARAVLVMEGVSDFLWDPVGRALATEALAALPHTDSGLRARLLAGTVVMESWQMPEDSGPRSLAALEMAERVGDRHALVEALRARQFAFSGPEGTEERLALGTRLLTVGADGDDHAILWGRLWRFDAFAQLGDIASVAVEADALMALADQLRSPLVRWHATRAQATLAAARGRFGEAVALGEQVIDLSLRSGHEGSVLPSLGYLIAVQALVGDFDTAPEETVLRHFGNVVTTGLRGMLAKWKVAAGRLAEAEQIYRGLPRVDQVPPFVRLLAAATLIELSAEFGDRDNAAQLYEVLLPYAHRFVCGGAGVILIEGSVELPLGVCAGALDRLDDAEAHLRRAIDLNTRAGLPPATLTAQYRLAQLLLRRARRGDRDEGATLAATVSAAAGALGMKPLRQAAAALTPGRREGLLTRREQEIAALVARGLTSRAIAADLHLSERTVETHVQHILTKLCLANRTQIASWVNDLRTATT